MDLDWLELCEDDEPSCYEKVITKFNDLSKTDQRYIESLAQRLKHEDVTWYQPWYQVNNSLSRPIKNDATLGETFRTDAVCRDEERIIKNNWIKFLKQYNVPDSLISVARWKNKKQSRLPNTPEELARRFVVGYLARDLRRTKYQIFRHIATSFAGAIKGAYSAKEERVMEIIFSSNPENAVPILSKVLNREPRGIYKRLEQLFNGKPEKKRIKWTLPLATKFLKRLLKYTKLPLEQLKYKKIEKKVWLKLGRKFDHHYVYLQQFWYQTLHVQIFVKKSVKLNRLRKQVFNTLKLSPYRVWSDIRWKDLVKRFPDGMTHRFLYNVCRSVVCKHPKYLEMPLSEIADIALSKIQNQCYRKKRLKTLAFNEDGNLEIVRHP